MPKPPDNIQNLNVFLDDLSNRMLRALGPKQQERAKKEIAKHLRANMRKRITAQEDIYGQKFEPRKKQKFRWDNRFSKDKAPYLRRKPKKMLIGFRDKAWLRTEFQRDKLMVGYKAGRTGYTAKVHNEGLTQQLKGKQGQFYAHYPERRWIGLSDEDRAMVEDVLSEYLVLE